MRLFRLVNHKLELVRDELLTITEFRKVLEFGTGKYTPEQYFIFIYHYCDYTSPYSSYPDEIRFTKAVYEAGFELDYKIDDIVKDAVKRYLEIRETPTIKSLKSANKALLASDTLIGSIVKKLNKNLETLDKTDISTITDESELAMYNAKVKLIRDDLGYVLGLIPKLEGTVEIVSKLTDKAIKDDFSDLKSKGGRVIGNRAEPKRE